MSDTSILDKYFPSLSESQQQKLSRLPELYKEWNQKINVVSRKDIDNILLHHIVHSLSISKVVTFKTDTSILDIGTGGGFPGIPLAILFPECKFTLIDSIGKKIKVVQEVSKEVGLENIEATHSNAKEISGKFDYFISRAVKSIKEMNDWIKHLKKPNSKMIFLKGGDLSEEISSSGLNCQIERLADFFEEEYFVEKKVVVCKI